MPVHQISMIGGGQTTFDHGIEQFGAPGFVPGIGVRRSVHGERGPLGRCPRPGTWGGRSSRREESVSSRIDEGAKEIPRIAADALSGDDNGPRSIPGRPGTAGTKGRSNRCESENCWSGREF